MSTSRPFGGSRHRGSQRAGGGPGGLSAWLGGAANALSDPRPL